MRKLSDNARGALLMTMSMAFFTVNDSCMKGLGGEMPLFQVILFRGILVSLILVPLALRLGGLELRLGCRNWVLVGIRSIGEVGAAYFFISALFYMPLANANAVLQALPLTVTLAGALFLREPVGWRRLAAILVGFVGVLLIVRPGAEGFNIYSSYALISVACVTLRDLATRRLGAEVPSLTIATVGGLGVTLFGAIGTVGIDWAPITPRNALLLVGAAVFVIGGYLTSVVVMRTGDIGFVAPFRYTGLLWALILGFVLFGDWPQPLTLAGGAIVVGSGLFTLSRQRRRPPVPLRIR